MVNYQGIRIRLMTREIIEKINKYSKFTDNFNIVISECGQSFIPLSLLEKYLEKSRELGKDRIVFTSIYKHQADKLKELMTKLRARDIATTIDICLGQLINWCIEKSSIRKYYCDYLDNIIDELGLRKKRHFFR